MSRVSPTASPPSLPLSPTGGSEKYLPRTDGIAIFANRMKLTPAPHSILDDAQALLTGTLLFSLGIVLFGKAGLLMGGTAGVTFLLHYATDLPFGWLYFLINLPCYVFAQRALGWTFTIKTFAAVSLLSVYSEALPRLISIEWIEPVFAAVLGGVLAGAGLLMLIRHKASLGGLGVLAIWLQDRKGWRAGKVQMAADCVIVGAAVFVVEPWGVLVSALGAVMLNFVLAVNHKPGRYDGY